MNIKGLRLKKNKTNQKLTLTDMKNPLSQLPTFKTGLGV